MASEGDHELAGVLKSAYRLEPAGIARVHAGTATDNYVVSDVSGRRWFAKVYRDHSTLHAEQSAIDLAEFACAGGVPVPHLHRAKDGDQLGRAEHTAMSLWDFVEDAVTAEGGLSGAGWTRVGAVLGRLHRRLAEHPAARPSRHPAAGICDGEKARRRYDWLIAKYQQHTRLDEFQVWALDAAQQRRALLPTVDAILHRLPSLTTQIVHGDLASPNLLLRGEEVAAVIDFQPPSPRFVSWEIARMACDPRTVMFSEDWMYRLPELLSSYREENPSIPIEDLTSALAVGCAYTISSTYPLAEPIENPGGLDASLQAYAHTRHDAAMRMLKELDRNSEMLLDIASACD